MTAPTQRFAILAAAIAVVSILAGCGDSRMLAGDPAIKERVPRSKVKVISVATFRDQSIGTRRYQPWEMGIPEQVMEAISAVPYFRVVARQYMLQTIIREQEFQLTGATDQGSAVHLGRLMNAQYMVTGTFTVFQERMQIRAQVFAVESAELVCQTSVEGAVMNFFSLQRLLAIKLVEGLNVTLNPEARDIIARRYDTRNLEASLANYAGERSLENAELLKATRADKASIDKELDTARDKFREAVKNDDSYTRARKNLARITQGVPMTL